MKKYCRAHSRVSFKSLLPLVLVSGFLSLLLGTSCKPARSDFFVETLDTANINISRRIADTITRCTPDDTEMALGTVACETIWIHTQNRSLRVAYGINDAVVALKESINGVTADSAAFYPNGQRMFRVRLNDQGQPEGLIQHYYPDGRLKEDGRIILGVKNGVWRRFDETGKLIGTEEFDKWGRKM